MARSTKMSVIKRQRERKKAEKAALKREMRAQKKPEEGTPRGGDQLATQDDLEGYGLIPEPEESDDDADPN